VTPEIYSNSAQYLVPITAEIFANSNQILPGKGVGDILIKNNKIPKKAG